MSAKGRSVTVVFDEAWDINLSTGEWKKNDSFPRSACGLPTKIRGKKVLVQTGWPWQATEKYDYSIGLRHECKECRVERDGPDFLSPEVVSVPFIGDRFIGTVMLTDRPVNHRIHFFDTETKKWSTWGTKEWPSSLHRIQVASSESHVFIGGEASPSSLFVVDLEGGIERIALPCKERNPSFFASIEGDLWIAGDDALFCWSRASSSWTTSPLSFPLPTGRPLSILGGRFLVSVDDVERIALFDIERESWLVAGLPTEGRARTAFVAS